MNWWSEVVQANEKRECVAKCGRKRSGNGWTCGNMVCQTVIRAQVSR